LRVGVNQLHLPNGSQQLPPRNRVGFVGYGHQTASRSHCPRRHQHDFYSLFFRLSNLTNQVTHDGNIRQAIFTGNDIGTYFDNDFLVSRSRHTFEWNSAAKVEDNTGVLVF